MLGPKGYEGVSWEINYKSFRADFIESVVGSVGPDIQPVGSVVRSVGTGQTTDTLLESFSCGSVVGTDARPMVSVPGPVWGSVDRFGSVVRPV